MAMRRATLPTRSPQMPLRGPAPAVSALLSRPLHFPAPRRNQSHFPAPRRTPKSRSCRSENLKFYFKKITVTFAVSVMTFFRNEPLQSALERREAKQKPRAPSESV